MKKILLILMCISVMMLAACDKKEPIEDEPEKEVVEEKEDIEFSDEYFVGFDYGGLSWGDYYDCIDARVIICTNRDVLIYLPIIDEENRYAERLELAETLKLTDEQYENIEKGVNRKKLYKLKIRSNEDVCDGSSTFLILYDKDENVLKACGAYEPSNKKFWEMYRTVLDNVPTEEIGRIRDEYAEGLKNKDKPSATVYDIDNADVRYDRDMLTRMFAERYSPPFFCELDHIDEDENYVFHLYEAVDNGDDKHTATIEWYTINPYTGDVTTFLDDHFNIEDVLSGEVHLVGSSY